LAKSNGVREVSSLKGPDIVSTLLFPLLLVLFCPAFSIAGQEAAEPAGEVTLESVTGHLEAGRLSQALDGVVTLVETSPDSPEGWKLAMKVFDASMAGGGTDRLMETAIGLTELLADRPGPWILLGKVYLGQAGVIRGVTGFEGTFRQGLLFQGAESFRAALERDPMLAEAGNHLAYTLFLRRNFNDAGSAAEEVLKNNPENGYARYLLGEVALRLNRAGEALERFRSALEQDKDLLDALSGQIRALTLLEKRDDAGRLLLKLVGRDPERPEISGLAAAIFEGVGKYLDAAALYREILALRPERNDIVFQLAVVEYRLEDFDGARGHIGQVLEQNPRFDAALYFKGLIAERRRLFDEALLSYLAALECEGGYFDFTIERLKVLAFTKAGGGLFGEAIAIYDRLIPILPFDTILAGNRALALAQCGRREEADEAYRSILEISPRDSQIINDYALHLMGSGRVEEGLRTLKRAFAVDGCLDACENLGAYYFYTVNDREEAERFFSLVLESDPAREKALVLRESIRRNRGRGGD
jgi:tetratricopeptide (TPR) repeat protein